jgi:hypothetical protein
MQGKRAAPIPRSSGANKPRSTRNSPSGRKLPSRGRRVATVTVCSHHRAPRRPCPRGRAVRGRKQPAVAVRTSQQWVTTSLALKRRPRQRGRPRRQGSTRTHSVETTGRDRSAPWGAQPFRAGLTSRASSGSSGSAPFDGKQARSGSSSTLSDWTRRSRPRGCRTRACLPRSWRCRRSRPGRRALER